MAPKRRRKKKVSAQRHREAEQSKKFIKLLIVLGVLFLLGYIVLQLAAG